MARRRHIKQTLIKAIKWTFWVFLIYCYVVFFAIIPSKEFSQKSEKMPTLDNIISDKLPLQRNINIDTMKSQNNATDKPAMSSTNVCLDISFPSHLAVEEAWQPVDNFRSMYAFSAYHVEHSRMVYVTGVRPSNKVFVLCQLWQRIKGNTLELVKETEANVRALLDDRGHRYVAAIFECFSGSSVSPAYVSLVTKTCDIPLNALHIRSATKELPYKRRLTVCVPPLRLQYNNTKEFVKWMEFNKLLGVEKFVMYNYSSSGNMARVLDLYTSQGLTDIIQWRPPMVSEDLPLEIHRVEVEKYGETVALNDCLLRNKRYSEFIVSLGINEFIIPHTENEATLTDMVNALGNKAPAYHIGMSYLKKNKTVIEQTEKTEAPRSSLDKNQELVNIERVLPISKLIIRTADVDFTFNNTVPGMKAVSVPDEKLLMHRYPGGGQYQKLGMHIDDALPENLVNKAKSNVQNVWNSVPNAFGN